MPRKRPTAKTAAPRRPRRTAPQRKPRRSPSPASSPSRPRPRRKTSRSPPRQRTPVRRSPPARKPKRTKSPPKPKTARKRQVGARATSAAAASAECPDGAIPATVSHSRVKHGRKVKRQTVYTCPMGYETSAASQGCCVRTAIQAIHKTLRRPLPPSVVPPELPVSRDFREGVQRALGESKRERDTQKKQHDLLHDINKTIHDLAGQLIALTSAEQAFVKAAVPSLAALLVRDETTTAKLVEASQQLNQQLADALHKTPDTVVESWTDRWRRRLKTFQQYAWAGAKWVGRGLMVVGGKLWSGIKWLLRHPQFLFMVTLILLAIIRAFCDAQKVPIKVNYGRGRVTALLFALGGFMTDLVYDIAGVASRIIEWVVDIGLRAMSFFAEKLGIPIGPVPAFVRYFVSIMWPLILIRLAAQIMGSLTMSEVDTWFTIGSAAGSVIGGLSLVHSIIQLLTGGCVRFEETTTTDEDRQTVDAEYKEAWKKLYTEEFVANGGNKTAAYEATTARLNIKLRKEGLFTDPGPLGRDTTPARTPFQQPKSWKPHGMTFEEWIKSHRFTTATKVDFRDRPRDIQQIDAQATHIKGAVPEWPYGPNVLSRQHKEAIAILSKLGERPDHLLTIEEQALKKQALTYVEGPVMSELLFNPKYRELHPGGLLTPVQWLGYLAYWSQYGWPTTPSPHYRGQEALPDVQFENGRLVSFIRWWIHEGKG